MSNYKHGRVHTYNDPRHHGLSYQHRDDGHGTCPLPEHGSHTQGQHNHHDVVKRGAEPRPIVEINRANDSKVGGHGWSSK